MWHIEIYGGRKTKEAHQQDFNGIYIPFLQAFNSSGLRLKMGKWGKKKRG